jgi:hypothetical protein
MGKKQVAVSLRKPPPADPDAFVAGTEARPASTQIEHVTEGPTVVTRIGERREMTVYLPMPLARQLSVRCVELDRDVSSVVTEAVVKMLAIEEPLPEPPAPELPAPPPPSFGGWLKSRGLVAQLRARLPLGLGFGPSEA